MRRNHKSLLTPLGLGSRAPDAMSNRKPKGVMRRMIAVMGIVIVTLLIGTSSLPSASSEDPALSIPDTALDLDCPGGVDGSDHEPVLLVHGTGATGEENWGRNYSHFLAALGYPVCIVDLPNRALGDMQVSAGHLILAVRRMAADSNKKVDIVGHSQGGLVGRWALRWSPQTRSLVDDLVTLGSPHHGTGEPIFRTPALLQMKRASMFLKALNSVDETYGDASYTSIWGYEEEENKSPDGKPSSYLDGASNLPVQEVCQGRRVGHLELVTDPAVMAMVLDALSQPGPADKSRMGSAPCSANYTLEIGLVEGTTFVLGLTTGVLFSPALKEPDLAPYAAQS